MKKPKKDKIRRMSPEDKIELYAAVMLPVFIARRGDCGLGIVCQRDEDIVAYAKAMANLILNSRCRLNWMPTTDQIEARANAAWEASEALKKEPLYTKKA